LLAGTLLSYGIFLHHNTLCFLSTSVGYNKSCVLYGYLLARVALLGGEAATATCSSSAPFRLPPRPRAGVPLRRKMLLTKVVGLYNQLGASELES